MQLDPNPNGAGQNIADATNDPSNPANAAIAVGDSLAGVVDIDAAKVGAQHAQPRDSSDFNVGVAGRSDFFQNNNTAIKFTQPQMVIVQAKDLSTGGTGTVVAQRMLAISQNEVDQTGSVSLPASRGLTKSVLSGKFNFKAAAGKRVDTLNFSCNFALPGGVNFNSNQNVYFGIGNAIIKVQTNSKGKGTMQPPDLNDTATLVQSGVKSFILTLPKSATGLTAENSSATLKVSLFSADLVTDGFSFLGVKNSVAANQSVSIECLLLVGGVTYRQTVTGSYTNSKGIGTLIAK